MTNFKIIPYVDPIVHNVECYLAADIGGTNSNFGIFHHSNGMPNLILSLHSKSQEVQEFIPVVQDVLTYCAQTYGITIRKACFAIAGAVPVIRDAAKPTNLPYVIDTKDIIKQTDLECAFLANDFEVIGHGLDHINPSNIVKVNNGTEHHKANRAIVGAGTGLGKCILFWSAHRNQYVPVASEGGHADFAAQNELELELVQFVHKQENLHCNVSWEDVLSGNGIKRIHAFFESKNGKGKSNGNGPHPDEIFNTRMQDENCLQTYELYTKLYAQCAKNFALESLSLGGIYIAGGIAAKNLPLFKSDSFMKEFTNCGKQQNLLSSMPIYVITDYNVSLHGAMQYLLSDGHCP